MPELNYLPKLKNKIYSKINVTLFFFFFYSFALMLIFNNVRFIQFCAISNDLSIPL